jgi:transforming growth factor-beta-induced protein
MNIRTFLLVPLAILMAFPVWAGEHRGTVKSYASMIIRKYDANDDGKLNADEYPTSFRKYFGRSDSNQDGYVDGSELATQMENIRSQWRERMAGRAKEYRSSQARQLVDRAFDADDNKDGRLNADEASAVIKKSFAEVDADNNGFLVRAEVETAFGVKPQAVKTIVETANSAGSFKTLIKAAVAAQLAEALNGDGPFTVFAPTDEAFDKIPKDTLEALLKDKGQLASILKYHVVSGNVLARDVVKLTEAETLHGDAVTISTKDGDVRIDNAKVLKADIRCSNGVIHVIDTVLIPGTTKEAQLTEKTIIETAISAGSFETLVKAVEAAGLVEALGKSELTVFAPTDAAFAKLPEESLKELLADKKKLQQILTYHVVAGKVLARDVVELKTAKTLQGQSVQISVTDEGVKIDNANVLKTDINCSNGVIHVIDTVILPKCCPSKSDSDTVSELIGFGGGDFKKQWSTVNDGVMGGRSEGKVRLTEDETLEFYGNLSLRNNGGFASARSKAQNFELEDGDTLVARVRGDGREYSLNLYSPRYRMAFSFRAPIKTEKGEWVDVRVPLSDFYATSFGRRVNAKLKPSEVNGIGFLLSDKKDGAFRLEVDSIRVAKSDK